MTRPLDALLPPAGLPDGISAFTLLDVIEDGFYVIDDAFRFRYVNTRLCELWGRSRSDLLGRTVWEILPRSEATPAGQRLKQVALQRRTVSFEIFSEILQRWLRLRVSPLPAGWTAVHWRDITEAHQNQEALRRLNEGLEQQAEQRSRQLARSQARLQAFFDLSPDWLCLFRGGPNGPFRYVDLNRACEEAYGLPRERVIGHRVEEVLGEAAAQVPLHHFRECLRTGQRQHYVARRTMAGRTRTIDVVFVPVPEEQEGEERFILTTARDVTEREELEAQLRQAQKMEAVGQLTGGVAHDFNNLLTAVISSLELITRRARDEKTKSLAGTAFAAAMRGAQLTNQLLAFSRRQQLRPAVLDLRSVVAETEVLIRRTLGETIALTIEASERLWPARADAAQFQAAIMNLLVNARDAMPSGGRISVRLANVVIAGPQASPELPAGDYVVLCVADTGVGMPPDVLARATEPFFTTKGVGRGSGLGLSMVHGFATQSGGAIQIESTPGRGTTARLYLPRADPGARPGDSPSVEGLPPAQAARILFVEDNDEVRAAGTELLRGLGHAVCSARDAYEALAILRSRKDLDLLLTDVVMPGMSGLELARTARARQPDLPILLTSGYAADLPGQAEGAEFAFIAKPFHPAGLGRKITELLSARPGAQNRERLDPGYAPPPVP